MRNVELTLVVVKYVEQDGMMSPVLSEVYTHHISMNYDCFDTLEHIWHHIGGPLCTGRSMSIAAHIESDASALSRTIQQAVHEFQGIQEDEPIELTFTLQLIESSPDRQDGHEDPGVPEPTRTVPASKSSVQSLKRKRVADDNDDDDQTAKKVCVICQDEFGKEGRLVAMPCDHEFHEECIFGWLERAHSCPTCRFQLPTD